MPYTDTSLPALLICISKYFIFRLKLNNKLIFCDLDIYDDVSTTPSSTPVQTPQKPIQEGAFSRYYNYRQEPI